MKQTEDPCVYVDNNQENDVIIIVYVDDLLIGSRNINKLNKRKKRKCKMNDLEPISNILDIKILNVTDLPEARNCHKEDTRTTFSRNLGYLIISR